QEREGFLELPTQAEVRNHMADRVRVAQPTGLLVCLPKEGGQPLVPPLRTDIVHRAGLFPRREPLQHRRMERPEHVVSAKKEGTQVCWKLVCLVIVPVENGGELIERQRLPGRCYRLEDGKDRIFVVLTVRELPFEVLGVDATEPLRELRRQFQRESAEG